MTAPNGPEPDPAAREALPPDLADLHPFLDRLTAAGYPASFTAGRWAATRAPNGANNAVYRATAPGLPAVALKFTTVDERDRAGREHRALSALAAAGLDLAPRPLALLRYGRADPVLVVTWIEGDVLPDPPRSDTGWARLVAHYRDVHSVAGRGLPRAVCTMTGADDGRAHVHAEMERLPSAWLTPELRALSRRVEAASLPELQVPRVCLCRCDPNPSNFVRRGGPWRSVDWENAGWGDPAFELTDLLGHPACLDLPAGRRRAVRESYAAAHPDDATLLERAAVYDGLWACWWAFRFARMEAEMNAGTAARRVSQWRPDPAEVGARGRAYLARARDLLG